MDIHKILSTALSAYSSQGTLSAETDQWYRFRLWGMECQAGIKYDKFCISLTVFEYDFLGDDFDAELDEMMSNINNINQLLNADILREEDGYIVLHYEIDTDALETEEVSNVFKVFKLALQHSALIQFKTNHKKFR